MHGCLFRLPGSPRVRRDIAVWDTGDFGVYPGFGVTISRGGWDVRAFAQVCLLYEGHNIQCIILFTHDYVVASTHLLPPEVKGIDRLRALFAASSREPFLVGAIKNGLGGTNGGTHGTFALARAVITQVAFLHVMTPYIELWHSEGT